MKYRDTSAIVPTLVRDFVRPLIDTVAVGVIYPIEARVDEFLHGEC